MVEDSKKFLMVVMSEFPTLVAFNHVSHIPVNADYVLVLVVLACVA